ncbi:uncharacterized protein LOC131805334 [Musca domestica]|uniref:Uncharacterized protein LOC131805334 n=1 Tax=Musca domestica TaxID=7370 RepID=A0A1I8NJV2_MUSDO|nr:uncharacterized protein LOC131805334 [Musca domestica]
MIKPRPIILISIVCLLYSVQPAYFALYEFILENDEVFDDCPQIPGNHGIHDLFDITNVTLAYSEGHVTVSGWGPCAWEGVEPTDRIGSRTIKIPSRHLAANTNIDSCADFCETLFDPTSMTYQVWSRHIHESERKCINNNGHIYHHQPFEVDTVFQFPLNVEGRHKLVVKGTAYDLWNRPRPKEICFQIFVEFIKVK